MVCVDVPGCEHGAILATADGGTVIFFSMATSFSAAALGAEGLAADVTMLVGNGYVPGHAELALDLLRTEPGVRALFERRLAARRADRLDRRLRSATTRRSTAAATSARPDHPAATALLVRGGPIAWVGDRRRPPADGDADEVVDLAGALVTPAFVDAHVHATSTGLALTGLDLTGAASLADCLRRVEDAGRRARGGVVLGHGWDETTWPEHRPPTRQELDRASYGGVVYLSRIDVHSAVVSSALLAAAPEARGQDGWSTTAGT